MATVLNKFINKMRNLKPGQILIIGFASVIAIGTILLALPIATTSRGSLSPVDALFTATSSVCVTGLTVENTGVMFTLFGQIVILILIQIGGLGFMTMASLIFMMIGRRISLRERLIIQEAYNLESIQGVVKLVRTAVFITFTAEFVGAAIISIRMIKQFGIAKGIYQSIFLSVSAFCNAGFDALGQAASIREYVADPIINITIMCLVTFGGLGFPVFIDILRKRRLSRLMIHSKVVLLVSAVLFISGALLIGILEWNNTKTLGQFSSPVKVMASCFQSVTLRTAGFETIPQGDMTPSGTLVSTILMFIGASPASTGGGIKTSTFFIVMLAIFTTVKGKQDCNVFRRSINQQSVRKAYTIAALALCLVLVDTVVISAVENITNGARTLSEVLFEVVSAFGTVGLSTGITGGLYWISKTLIIITMFIGRLGPLTLSMTISGAALTHDTLHYPEERMIIG
ncbi:MAG: potassium transporter TrkG [Oscillospiraceae bacterium]|nr:potassium transporter TrkG [Oscillospiraceae bacterium]MDD3832797.1 potassium transporter TrkG [Oscillospiraceae bacterium]MDD4546566.1 potassium transporter TrkG [Oscillospiraceae bacterium]